MGKWLISPEKCLYKIADPAKISICERNGFAVGFQALGITDQSQARTLAIIPLDDSDREVAERIVACVNAMEGIDDPAAVRVLLDEPQTQYAADMLAALKRLVELDECHQNATLFRYLATEVKALIKKVGG